ncbi:hypothetical protein [Cerasicoccus maritimus]|uniref:hypothetical protein n=1 Tax=Cerasicoccus maritimus TaxID=490089 RepID=UPI00285284DB|nr:hypothetical protein [Cerasicoccus maritimus]
MNSGLLWFVDECPMQRRRLSVSFASARQWMPDADVAIVYQGDPPDLKAKLIPYHGDGKKFLAKFHAWELSPYERTLFLDNDTVVLRDLTSFFRNDEKVVALPYPNMLSRDLLPPDRMELRLKTWRNINSGVISFPSSFVAKCAAYIQEYADVINTLPGKDQYFISYVLNQSPELFVSSLVIQVTSTPMAVRYLEYLKQASSPFKFGDVSIPLMLDAYVFHYTHNKELYEKLILDEPFMNVLSGDFLSYDSITFGEEANAFSNSFLHRIVRRLFRR